MSTLSSVAPWPRESATAPEPCAAIWHSMWWPAEAQTNLPASSENRSAMARALRRLMASPVRITAPLSMSSRLDAGIAVAAADKARELVDVDGVVGQVGREQDRRLPEDLAVDHHEAARQRGAEPLQMHAREHQVRGRGADVDADRGQLDIVGRPGDLVDLLAGSDVQVVEFKVVHRRLCGGLSPARGRSHDAFGRFERALVDELAHAGLHAVLGQLIEIDAVDARVLVLVFDLAAAVLHVDVHAREHVALGLR